MKKIVYFIPVFLFLFSNIIFFKYRYDENFYFFYNGRFLSNIIEGIIFASLDMKKQYADLLYIRMLQYYGKKKVTVDDYLGGDYPLMYKKVRDIALIDPNYFNAIILGSTIIAFGLYETHKAKSIINMILLSNIVDSSIKFKYLTLLAAIVTYESNKKKFVDDKILLLLYETAIQTDSSDMFKNIVAFLCLKNNKIDLAISLYLNLLNNSKDPHYRNRALNQLKVLGVL